MTGRTWLLSRCFATASGSRICRVARSKVWLRSQAERITRTLKPGGACNPFEGCGREMDHRQPQNPQEAYRRSCPICRLFGSTHYGGRLATTDAYAVGPVPRPQQRDGVGIDRFTGGSYQGAKFDLEVIVGGTFEARLHLRNYELWQLGLVGFCCRTWPMVIRNRQRQVRAG